MTRYLEDFTELLPQQPGIEALKTELLRDVEAKGMVARLRAKAITPEIVGEGIKQEISLLTTNVASALEQREFNRR